MTGLDLLGLFAGLCFMASSIPLVYQVIRNKSAKYVPLSTILSVWLGSISMFIYLIITKGLDLWVILDYGVTIINWFIILLFKLFKKDWSRSSVRLTVFY